MEEALSGVRHRLRGLRPVREAFGECLELARKVGLDEIEEEDIDSLLETIGEELSTEDLDELEKQQCQLEEVEAEQHPTTPLMAKQLMVKILQCYEMLT